MNHSAFFICDSIDQNGWLPYERVCLPVDDLGFRQSVTAVERLRTYNARPFQLDEHLRRFDNTLRLIAIEGVLPASELAEKVGELLDRNHDLIEKLGDVGITIWATPGNRSGGRPTLALHLNKLDHLAVARRRKDGQTVVLTDVVQPGPQSWSRQAKVRCRLHYHLADGQAREIASLRGMTSDATGVLLDSDGTWTESSVANVGLVVGREIHWPPAARVLPGITQAYVRKLAGSMGIVSREAGITTSDIRNADALLLMGTDTGLWFASEVVDASGQTVRSWSPPINGTIVRLLQAGMPVSPPGC